MWSCPAVHVGADSDQAGSKLDRRPWPGPDYHKQKMLGTRFNNCTSWARVGTNISEHDRPTKYSTFYKLYFVEVNFTRKYIFTSIIPLFK